VAGHAQQAARREQYKARKAAGGDGSGAAVEAEDVEMNLGLAAAPVGEEGVGKGARVAVWQDAFGSPLSM
jgi:hypothetical protein